MPKHTNTVTEKTKLKKQIEKLKKAERELEESERRFHLLADTKLHTIKKHSKTGSW